MDFDKFQQFQPKSLKEVLEESKQQQISEMKELAEASKDYIQEWYQEHMQYLKENNSDSHAVQGGDDWNPSGATYNHEGNRVVFYDVIGGDGNNEIDMDTRTHDVIDGGEGYDTIRGGWGNDVITGGENTRNSWPQQDLMYGEDGNDTIYAHANDKAWGGRGRDLLHGYSGSELWGGSGSDVFQIQARDVGEGNDFPTEIHDFSSKDRIVVNFRGSGARADSIGNAMTYIAGYENGIRTLVHDDSGRQVAMINEVDLGDYSVDVSSDGMTVTITGSDFV